MDILIHYIVGFGYLGYIFLFFIIFFESFPFTFFLPGDSLLFTTGFLASQGYFNFIFLLVIFFAAGTIGYLLSYTFGEKIREIILKSNDRYWFKKKHLEYTQEFYEKYGAKTIIIGRFVPIVRSFAPTLAGAVDMKFEKFLRYTLFGGIFWVGIVTSAGYYLGKAIPGIHLYLTPIILSIVFISLLPTIWEYINTKRKKI
jgi:membrane-associated protein